MRLVQRPEDFATALDSARREALASFGDPACLVQKYISHPRHIEIQVSPTPMATSSTSSNATASCSVGTRR